MAREISIIDTRPRPIAVVRVRTVLSKWPAQFRQALDKVYDAVRTGRVRQSGQNVMVYRPREDSLVDIECGVETDARFEPVGEVVYCETPSGATATTAHVGPYERLGVSHDALVGWCRRNGHPLTGVCWEVYGDWDDDPAKLRTDIFHLVHPRVVSA
jgi:effector-binding domain-containing protein